MKNLPSSLAPAGYSPARLNPLSLAKVSDQGQRLTDLMAIQRLFANGEQGGYWPADPAYLYEDSAGTIPASVNGVVGCWYDAHYRLKELGSEVFSTFPTPTISNYSGTVGVWNSGTLTMTNTGSTVSGFPLFRFDISGMTIEKRYSADGQCSGNLSKLLYCRLATSGTVNNFPYGTINGMIYGETQSSLACVEFVTNLAVGESLTINYLSIKEVLGNTAVQATTANKPYLRKTPVSNKVWLDSNTATGALNVTFSGSLGSACTIATVGAEGVTIAENQTVGTTYNLTPPYGYNGDVLIINRLLTAAEKALVTRVMWRNVPTLGSNLTLNGAFSADTDWTKGTGWSITDVATKSAGTASNLTQNLGVSGNQYRVIADITRTAGTVGAYNGTAQIGATAATEMAAKYAMKTTSTTIGFRGDSSFAGTIDNAVIQDIL